MAHTATLEVKLSTAVAEPRKTSVEEQLVLTSTRIVATIHLETRLFKSWLWSIVTVDSVHNEIPMAKSIPR